MPPKAKRILKSKNVKEDEEETQRIRMKKVRISEQNVEEQSAETNQQTKNWREVMEKALTGKQIKTIVKSLATNAEEAIEQLSVSELQRALYTISFIAIPEGQKFCLRSLPKIGVKSAYYLIHKIAADGNISKQNYAHYGEFIAVAWKYYHKEDEKVCKEIEDEIIKGLFHDAIVYTSSISNNLIEMLSAFQGVTTTYKAKMDDMLYQASRVSLWRNCMAVNNQVRFRATKIMLKFFPWRPTDPQELEEVTNKQYELFSKMLRDSCSEIRREASCKILKILSQYWVYIPSYTKRNLLGFICDELIKDSDPSIRCAILEGLGFMVMEAVCQNASEAALKAVCPVTIIDKNDNVRYQTLKLLYKLIPNRFTKYWDIVPIETIMKILEIESSESVKKEIVRLVFKSFCQKDDDYIEAMKRLNYLAKFGRNATLIFYKTIVPEKLIEIQDAVSHLKNMGLALYRLVSGNCNNDSKMTNISALDDTVGSLTGPAGEMIDEKHPKFSRAKLFMDCAVVLYATLLREPTFNYLGSEEQKDVKGGVAKLMTKIFQKMFQYYRETSALGTTMLLGSLLPQEHMAGTVRSVLRLIKEETDNEIVKPYLEAVTQWDPEAMISIIRDGLKTLAKSTLASPAVKKNRPAVILTTSQQLSKSLYYLSYILSSSAAKDVLIRSHLYEISDLYTLLCPIKRIINMRLKENNPLDIDDDVIVEAYVMKQTLICVLLNAPRKSESEVEIYVRHMCEETEWFEDLLKITDDIVEKRGKREFFFKLGNAFLRKLCDVLMCYDFSSIPSNSVRTDSEPDASVSAEQVTYNYIESFKTISYRFLRSETPSEFMPSVFNISRQLYLLNPEHYALAIETINFTPSWITNRVDFGDDLKDKQIGEQHYLLLKALADCPQFQVYPYMTKLARNLIDILQWIIQDCGNCADPREHSYEVPQQLQILIFDSIKKHSFLFRIFGQQFLELCQSKSLLAKSKLEHNLNRLDEQVSLEVLGACTQLAYLLEYEPDKSSKKTEVLDDDIVSKILQEIKRKMDKLEEKFEGRVDQVLILEIKTMLTSE